jgi:protein involved in polysaccharide export with SLBB domain
MRTIALALFLLLLLPLSYGDETPARPVTVIGVVAKPVDVPWEKNLTLSAVVLRAGGVSNPGPTKFETFRVLPDGTESKTTHNILHIVKKNAEDPRLHPGDRVVVAQKTFNF